MVDLEDGGHDPTARTPQGGVRNHGDAETAPAFAAIQPPIVPVRPAMFDLDPMGGTPSPAGHEDRTPRFRTAARRRKRHASIVAAIAWIVWTGQVPAPRLGTPPGAPTDIDLPRPHPQTYPPVRSPALRAAAPVRGLFWQQDAQSLGTVQAYTFGLLVDKATKPVPLAATCQAQPTALVFGCSAAFRPAKGTHQYRVQTTCPFCVPTTLQSDPITVTY